MTALDDDVHRLSARLPELAWRLSMLYSVLNPKLLPRGLFYEQFEMTPQSCIDEINADLQTLNDHDNERSVHYLAKRVSQKINVLVRLCQKQIDKKTTGVSQTFGVQTISTRQQWLITLQEEIARLSAQQLALTTALSQLHQEKNPQTILNLQAEVGEVERRLTLARETLTRATLK